MGIDPTLDDMEAHLALLYDWTQTQYPDALFEMRCIHPNGKVRDKRFTCTPAGFEQALHYAVKHNDTGYNVYVTANVLKSNTTQTATDDDVAAAIFHFIDADGVNDPDLVRERSKGFRSAFTTLTGTIPLPRSQVYWRMSHPITDMMKWSATQEALAQEFGTDSTVTNPSRVLRLAGTVSHPSERKRKRGYITELTALDRTDNGEVCARSFVASFPYTEPARAAPEAVSYQPVADEGTGRLPLCVIEAALQAIPPIIGGGQRNRWLDVAQSCRDAHPDSFHLFDQWQRQSARYEKSDSSVWDTLRPPSPGSYKSLLSQAKHADSGWWRHHSGEVYDWGCRQAARLNALQTSAGDGDSDDTPQEPQKPAATQPRYKAGDLFPMLSTRQLMDQPQMAFLIDEFIPEDAVVVVWGDSQDCKSFMLIDQMLCMSHGVLWHGRKAKKCAVAYIVAEGSRGVGKRIRGWKLRHKAEHIDDPFFAIPTAVNILKIEEVEKLIWQLQSMELALGIKFEVITVDTLAKCMIGGDENTARDMGIAIRHCDIIRERMGATVPLVHHGGKETDRGPRGSYALEAGVNTQIFVKRTRGNGEDFITASIDKQKDHDDDVKIRLKVVRVVLPLRPGDNPHKPESTLILETYTMDCEKAEPKPMPGWEVDPKFADLKSIVSVLGDDSKRGVSSVAILVFGHDRHRQRVMDAVPTEWTEVKTDFGTRYVRLVTNEAGTRHFVECRHRQV